MHGLCTHCSEFCTWVLLRLTGWERIELGEAREETQLFVVMLSSCFLCRDGRGAVLLRRTVTPLPIFLQEQVFSLLVLGSPLH